MRRCVAGLIWKANAFAAILPTPPAGYVCNKVDGTFGMQVMYQKAPQEQNTAPNAGMQFFGQVDIDAKTTAMTVTLKDLTGASLYTKTLAPQRA